MSLLEILRKRQKPPPVTFHLPLEGDSQEVTVLPLTVLMLSKIQEETTPIMRLFRELQQRCVIEAGPLFPEAEEDFFLRLLPPKSLFEIYYLSARPPEVDSKDWADSKSQFFETLKNNGVMP